MDRPRNKELRTINLWIGALAPIQGNVASIHSVLVFHSEMQQIDSRLLLQNLFFRHTTFGLISPYMAIRHAQCCFGISIVAANGRLPDLEAGLLMTIAMIRYRCIARLITAVVFREI